MIFPRKAKRSVGAKLFTEKEINAIELRILGHITLDESFLELIRSYRQLQLKNHQLEEELETVRKVVLQLQTLEQ